MKIFKLFKRKSKKNDEQIVAEHSETTVQSVETEEVKTQDQESVDVEQNISDENKQESDNKSELLEKTTDENEATPEQETLLEQEADVEQEVGEESGLEEEVESEETAEIEEAELEETAEIEEVELEETAEIKEEVKLEETVESEEEVESEETAEIEEVELEETAEIKEEAKLQETAEIEEEVELEETIEPEGEVESEEIAEIKEEAVFHEEKDLEKLQGLGYIPDSKLLNDMNTYDASYDNGLGYIPDESMLTLKSYDLIEGDKIKRDKFDIKTDLYVNSQQAHVLNDNAIEFINEQLLIIRNELPQNIVELWDNYLIEANENNDFTMKLPKQFYKFQPYTKNDKIKKNCYTVNFTSENVDGRVNANRWQGQLFFNRDEEIQKAKITMYDKHGKVYDIRIECKYDKAIARNESYKYASSGKRLKKEAYNKDNANHLHIMKGQKLPQWNKYSEIEMKRFKEILTSKTIGDEKKQEIRESIINNVQEDVVTYKISIV